MARKLDTNISSLLSAYSGYSATGKKSAVFLSDWDSPDGLLPPRVDLTMTDDELRKYHFWTDDNKEREPFAKFMKEVAGISISCDEFLIASNGTAALSISLQVLWHRGIKRMVAITPTYFTVLEKARSLGMTITEFPLSLADDFYFDQDKFSSMLASKEGQVVVLTLPYFGTGVEPPDLLLSTIVELCCENGAWLLVDDLYGGMPWKQRLPWTYVFDGVPFLKLYGYERLVFIESISKRLFMNGCKTALLISMPDFIEEAARLSIIEVGSMCSAQTIALKQLYQPEHVNSVADQIMASAEIAIQRYRQLQLLLSKYSDCLLSKTSNGHYTLVGIPFSGVDEMEYAKTLLLNEGLFTVPHSRYLHQCSGWYCFRVNLLLPYRDFIVGISTLGDLLSSK